MIHVLIERHIALDMEATYERISHNTLHSAYHAPGFITGEAFKEVKNSHTRFVMSKWRSVQDWRLWYNSEDRRNMMNEINLLLSQPEKITILEN